MNFPKDCAGPQDCDRAQVARIFGVTRFSVYQPGSGAWKLSRNAGSTETAYFEALYHEKRMETRFHLLRRALPIYQAMSEVHDYRHILHYSAIMPNPWRARLLNLADEFPVVLLDEVEGKPSTERVISRAMTSSSAQTGPIAWFRVDDDDLLSIDYIDGLKQYLTERNVGLGVSFGSGLAALFEGDQMTALHRVHVPMLGLGLAFIGWFDRDRGEAQIPQPSVAHSRTDTRVPVIVDSRDVRFIWVHHLGQDTKSASTIEQNERRIEQTFTKWERVSEPTSLIQKFPTLASDFELLESSECRFDSRQEP